jgi:hypothetical protein
VPLPTRQQPPGFMSLPPCFVLLKLLKLLLLLLLKLLLKPLLLLKPFILTLRLRLLLPGISLWQCQQQ